MRKECFLTAIFSPGQGGPRYFTGPGSMISILSAGSIGWGHGKPATGQWSTSGFLCRMISTNLSGGGGKTRKFKDSPYVFVDDHRGPNYGKPYKVRRLFLKSLCKKAGVKPFGFHALRRYVASVLADTHKVSTKQIQRILRHKSLHTTERYIKNINQDLKETLNLLSQKKYPKTIPEKQKGLALIVANPLKSFGVPNRI